MTEADLRAESVALAAKMRSVLVANKVHAAGLAAADKGIASVVTGDWRSKEYGGLGINPRLDDSQAVRNLIIHAMAREMAAIADKMTAEQAGIAMSRIMRKAGL